jgi:hypothetical protein
MTRIRTLFAVLVIVQFIGSGNAHATPGCSAAMPAPASSPVTDATSATNQDAADYCQWHYANPSASNGQVTNGGGDSGNFYGTATAPTPDSASCATPPCITSNGIRQDAGVTNILYNNFYPGMTINNTTTCRFVDNDNAAVGTGDLFVPQRSLNEYTDFIAHAPNIVVSYCVQAQSQIPYKATASYGSEFELWGGGATNGGATPATSEQTFSLPLARETWNGNYVAAPTSFTVSPPFVYTRKDCVNDAAGNALCNSWQVSESQTVTYVTAPNTNPDCTAANDLRTIGGGNGATDCDGSWAVSKVAIACTINENGVLYSGSGSLSCLAHYNPPAIQSCSANGMTYADGATYQVAVTGTATSTTTPPAPACGSGYTGTQTCATAFDYTYTCNDGIGTLTGTSTPTINVASCTGCTGGENTAFGASCTAGQEVGLNEAHAFVYVFPQLTSCSSNATPTQTNLTCYWGAGGTNVADPFPCQFTQADPSGAPICNNNMGVAYGNNLTIYGYIGTPQDGMPLSGPPSENSVEGVSDPMVLSNISEITAQDINTNLQFCTSTIDVPEQIYTQGFPGHPELNSWFGVCYDGSYNAPSSGTYTLWTAADDGMAVYIDDNLIVDNENGVVANVLHDDLSGWDENLIQNYVNDVLGGSSQYQGDRTIPWQVSLAAGEHTIMVKYYQSYPTYLGEQLLVTPPGGTEGYMQLGAPINDVYQCPH